MNTNTIRNRLLLAGHTLLLGLSLFFGSAHATDVTYDGIYQWSPGNFLSLHQDGTNMIATIYFTNDGDSTFPATAGVGTLPVPQLDLFDLMHGEVTGSMAAMDGTRFHRACNVGYDFKFNIDSSITVTRIGVSNTPAANSAGISCSAILGAEATTLTVPKIRFNPNSAPVANAGSAQSVVIGTLATLDGSASSDADGDTLTYLWALTAKPAGSTANLSSATSVRPTFNVDVAGTYVASLTVNDGKVSSAPATVNVAAAPTGSLTLSSTPTSDCFFSCVDRELTWPYSVNSSASVSSICVGSGCPTVYTIAAFKLRASGQSYTIANLQARNSTSGSSIAPLIAGLSNGQVIAAGQTATFSLQSPFTGGQTVNLTYSFTVQETGSSFAYSVQLRTN